MLFQGNAQSVASEKLKGFIAAPLLYTMELTTQSPPITWTQISPDNRVPTQKLNGYLIMVDYDWNLNNLPGLKQISKHAHDDSRKFGIRIPLAVIDKAFLNKPAWQLRPTPGLNRTSKDRHGEARRGRNAETEGKLDERKQVTQSEESENKPAIYCILSDYGYYLIQTVKALLDETRADVLIFDQPVLGAEDSTLTRVRCIRSCTLQPQGVHWRDVSVDF